MLDATSFIPICLFIQSFFQRVFWSDFVSDHSIREKTMPQILSMKAEFLVLLSFFMTFAVVTNAFYTKKQFYPSVVYLTKSSTSLAVRDEFFFISSKGFHSRYCMCKHLSLLCYLENLCREYFWVNFEQLKQKFVESDLSR